MSRNQITPKGPLLLSTSVVLLASLFAWGQSSSPSITPAEHPSRDTRIQILEGDLNDEQSALTEAIKRRAERLSANDVHGASEAEAALHNISKTLRPCAESSLQHKLAQEANSLALRPIQNQPEPRTQ